MRPQATDIRSLLATGVDGIFIKLDSTETIEAAAAHYDFCVIDLEHSSLGESQSLRLLQHARALGFPALLRLASVDPALINRALEAGASGIQLSNITQIAEVVAARRAMEFPPNGCRSASTAHAAARFGSMSLADYTAQAGQALLVIQIESETTADPLKGILDAGADVAFVGTSDLRVALGFDEARVSARITEVAAAAQDAGIVFGGFALDSCDPTYRIACSDVSLFAEAVARTSPASRSSAETSRAVVTTWSQIPDESVRRGIRRRAFGNDAAILVLNTCEPGMEVKPHSHDFDQIALILSGNGFYWVDGQRHPVGPDSLLLIPAGVEHYIEPTTEEIANLDLFAPPRSDYAHLLDWMASREEAHPRPSVSSAERGAS